MFSNVECYVHKLHTKEKYKIGKDTPRSSSTAARARCIFTIIQIVQAKCGIQAIERSSIQAYLEGFKLLHNAHLIRVIWRSCLTFQITKSIFFISADT